MVNDGRNPETCKASYNFHGIIMCTLDVMPCESIKKCARQRIYELLKQMEKTDEGQCVQETIQR